MNMYHGAGKLSFEERERNAKRDQIARDEAMFQNVRAHAKMRALRVWNTRGVQQGFAVVGMLAVIFGTGTIETMEL